MLSSRFCVCLFLFAALPACSSFVSATTQEFFTGDDDFDPIDFEVLPDNSTGSTDVIPENRRRSLSSIYCVTMVRTRNGIQTDERVYCKSSLYKSGTLVRNLDSVCNYGCYAYPGCNSGRMTCPNLDNPGAATATAVMSPWMFVMAIVGAAGFLRAIR